MPLGSEAEGDLEAPASATERCGYMSASTAVVNERGTTMRARSSATYRANRRDIDMLDGFPALQRSVDACCSLGGPRGRIICCIAAASGYARLGGGDGRAAANVAGLGGGRSGTPVEAALSCGLGLVGSLVEARALPRFLAHDGGQEGVGGGGRGKGSAAVERQQGDDVEGVKCRWYSVREAADVCALGRS